MDLWQALRTVVRRWYVFLPVFMVLVGASYGVASSLEPTYEATSIITLLPPQVAGTTDEEGPVASRNPYLTGEGGFERLTTVVVAASTGNDVDVRLREDHGFDDSTSFEVERQDGSSILTIVVEASTEEQALEGAVAVREVLDDVLEEQQRAAEVPGEWLVTSQTVSEAREVVVLSGARLRVAIGLGAASLLVAVGCAYFADGWITSRSGARRGSSDVAETIAPDEHEQVPDLFSREGDGQGKAASS